MRSATSSSEFDLERQIHAALGADQIRDRRNPRPFRPLEQQRRAAGLHRAVGDLRDLEDRIDFRRDSLQLAFLFQLPHEIPQVSIRHFPSLALLERAHFSTERCAQRIASEQVQVLHPL